MRSTLAIVILQAQFLVVDITMHQTSEGATANGLLDFLGSLAEPHLVDACEHHPRVLARIENLDALLERRVQRLLNYEVLASFCAWDGKFSMQAVGHADHNCINLLIRAEVRHVAV